MADIDLVKKSLIRRTTSEYGSADYGKLPPQAKEMEEAVLGAVMIEENAIYEVADMIKVPDVFYVDAHQRIWKAILALFRNHSKIDLLTVTEQLKKHGELDAAGGPFYIAQLTNKIGSAANVADHALYLVEKYTARQLISISAETTKNAYEDTVDTFELLDKTLGDLETINQDLTGQGQKVFYDMVVDETEKLRAAAHSGEYITGVPTYSAALDKALLGLQPENLVVVAGRPGMGKTSVVWHIAIQQAKNKRPVGFFSMEMSDRELIHKMIAAEITVDTKTVRKGGMKAEEWSRLDSKLDGIANLPIFMNDRAGLTINQIIAISRNWVRKHDVQVIYIDYIGKIKTTDAKKFGTREQEVSNISGQLKDLAKSLKIPVVVLSQLSRAVEQRGGDKRPILSDLRESGAVEQDADVVIFCYRPEYYGIETGEDGEAYPKGYTELDIQKYRHGDPGTARWIFEAKYSRFRDFGDEQIESAIESTGTKLRKLTEEEKPKQKTPDEDLPF